MSKIDLVEIKGHTFIGNLISKDSIVLDLGANRGEFALEVQRRWGCQIHAVEPTPELARMLRDKGQISVYEMAVNQYGQDVLFRVDADNTESSTIVSMTDENTISVAGIKLDNLLDKIGSVDLIKIDVEGSEIEILMTVFGGLITKVPQIVVEFHDFKKGAGISPEMVSKVYERMGGLGFDVFVMSYWTNGDVLFVNQRHISLGVFDKATMQIKGRWIPGFFRILNRLWRS